MKLKVYKSLLDVKMIMGLPYKVFISLVAIYILCAVMSVKDPMTLELIIEHYKTERYLNP